VCFFDFVGRSMTNDYWMGKTNGCSNFFVHQTIFAKLTFFICSRNWCVNSYGNGFYWSFCNDEFETFGRSWVAWRMSIRTLLFGISIYVLWNTWFRVGWRNAQHIIFHPISLSSCRHFVVHNNREYFRLFLSVLYNAIIQHKKGIKNYMFNWAWLV
jgi:hypothetical protein